MDVYSSGLLSAIVASSDDAIVSKDLEGVVTSWNRAAERLFGFTAEEMIGQHISRIIPPDRLAEEDFVMSRVRSGIGVDHFETVRLRKDGKPVEIALTVSPVRDTSGRIVGASKIAREISERKRMERDAVHLAAIVESSADAIFATAVDGVVQTWNAAAERMFGYAASEAIGQSIALLSPPDKYDEQRAILQIVLRGDRVAPYETIRRTRDGRAIHVSLSMAPIRVRGEIAGVSTIARDVSGERQLRIAAEQASRAKDEFLAMLGHELRNPLAPILTALHLMQIKGVVEAAPERAMIERQVRHVVSLVDDLLDVSRITGGKITLHRRPQYVSEIVEQAVETASPLLEERDHRLVIDVPRDESLRVDGDRARLAQVVANLLTNAAKYTEKQGCITVIAERTGEDIRLVVRDNGIGISSSMLPRIFELFAQERQPLNRAQGGLGLGLSIVRSLVNLHGGTVVAKSKGPGTGAEFEIRLPAYRPLASGHAETTPIDPPIRPKPGRALRVLVVDDNVDAAEALVSWLDHAGHMARAAIDGPTALGVTAEFAPDVALLDIGLPGMDGYELGHALRRRPGLGDVRLVAVTGYGQPVDYHRSRAEGFDAHLVKPVDVATLTETLDLFSRTNGGRPAD